VGLLDDETPDAQDSFIQRIARFEEGADGAILDWIGGRKGLLVGFALLIGTGALLALSAVLMIAIEESFASKLLFGFMLLVLAGVGGYWRRQRIAAHFEAARRLVESANPDERQRGLTEMIVNARRGRAEHRRIAGALTAYLRRPPHDHLGEGARRQIAFALLADYTLLPSAKEKLDLGGASLAGIRAVNADLPGVCLRGADLTGARFAGANLFQADFEGAKLEGADFKGAQVGGTILEGRVETVPPR
jgi:hypothetical protein